MAPDTGQVRVKAARQAPAQPKRAARPAPRDPPGQKRAMHTRTFARSITSSPLWGNLW
jgi:hypothetical protein